MASISFRFSPDYDPILILIGASAVAGGTATQFSYISQLTGAKVTVSGTGLTYDAAGKPLTGTITSMSLPSDLTTSTVGISGMAMPVATLVSTLLGFFAGTPSTPSQADRFLSILRAGNDQIVAGGTAAVVLSGGTGDDRIAVVEADSTLYGGLGNDTRDGSIGNDLLDGGLGADRLDGSMGWDIATWATAGSGVRADLLFDTVNPGFRGQVTTGTGIDTVIECEELKLTAFADVVQIANEGHDEGLAIWAGAGNDTLNALGAGGTLYGGDGIDLITGESTADGGRGWMWSWPGRSALPRPTSAGMASGSPLATPRSACWTTASAFRRTSGRPRSIPSAPGATALRAA